MPEDRTATVVYVQPDGPRLSEVVALLDAGAVSTDVDSVETLANASKALEIVTARRAKGAVVLSISR